MKYLLLGLISLVSLSAHALTPFSAVKQIIADPRLNGLTKDSSIDDIISTRDGNLIIHGSNSAGLFVLQIDRDISGVKIYKVPQYFVPSVLTKESTPVPFSIVRQIFASTQLNFLNGSYVDSIKAAWVMKLVIRGSVSTGAFGYEAVRDGSGVKVMQIP